MDTPVPQQHTHQPPLRASRRSFGLWLFLSSLVFLTLIVVIIMIARQDTIQIDEVRVAGVKTFPEQELVSFIEEYLKGTILGVIPRSSSLFFSKKQLQKNIQSRFPIVDLVYVSFVNPHTIGITVRERSPEAVWCFNETICGFIDRTGVLYGASPRFSDGVYTIFSSRQEKQFSEFIGKKIIEPELMYRFDALFKNLQSENIIISRVEFLEYEDVAFIIDRLFTLYPQKNVALLGTLSQDDVIFLRDVTTGLEHEVFQKQYRQQPKALEYIDLRFPGKIFYKFSGKEKSLEKVSELSEQATHTEIMSEE